MCPTLIVLQSLIDAADNNEVVGYRDSGNEANLSNLSTPKKFIKAAYLTFKGAKKGGGNRNNDNSNTKKGVKAAKSFNYLILSTKKAFHLLRHMFI